MQTRVCERSGLTEELWIGFGSKAGLAAAIVAVDEI